MSKEIYYDKIFHLKGNSSWKLPETDIFSENKWVIESLQERKKSLNLVKAQLNEFNLEEWSEHTKSRDPSSTVIKNVRQYFQPELLTQAWCKFYECLATFDLIPDKALKRKSINSVHLCEAPGAFISALNHFLYNNYRGIKLDWLANSYNPHYEGNSLNDMIPDDRLMRRTKDKWLFGADHTGDITKFYNHLDIKLKVSTEPLLVTADGSVNCMSDPGEQENHVSYLHYCELLTGLSILKKGGNFILKIFTIFEESTICCLYLLSCVFENVSIFKPLTSKSGNSELYVVCKNYRCIPDNIFEELFKLYKNPNLSKSMFSYKTIPKDFMDLIHQCVDFFMLLQTHTINENIKYFRASTEAENKHLQSYHAKVMNYFFEKCHMLRKIPNMKKIYKKDNITRNTFYGIKNSEGCFKRYYDVDKIISNVECKAGKKVENIYFSRFCPTEILNKLINFKRPAKGLFLKSKNCLLATCHIFDRSDYNINNICDIEKEILKGLINNLSCDKDVLFINIPVMTNFFAGVLFILFKGFTDIYFFKKGVIYLKKPNNDVLVQVKLVLNEILTNVLSLKHHENFECDILEVNKEEWNLRFLKCLWYFNNNF